MAKPPKAKAPKSAPKKRKAEDTAAEKPKKLKKTPKSNAILAVDKGVHSTTLLRTTPAKVTSMAYNSSFQVLCVGRENGALEFYAVKGETVCLKQSTTGHIGWHAHRMVWAGDRLFTSSLSQQIVEWDLVHLVPKGLPSSSYGGVVWDMMAHPEKEVICIATEDGNARLFDVMDYGLSLRSVIPRQTEDRLLAVCFSTTPTAPHIFLGTCKGYVSCWAWSTKEEIWATNLTKSPVWVIRQLDERLVATGNSMGTVHLLDTKTGIQVTAIRMLNADILTMATLGDSRCFISGVDNRLVQLTSTQVHGKVHWSKAGVPMTIHHNDVLTMCAIPTGDKQLLLTGGADGQLLVFDPTKPSSFTEVAQRHICCSSARIPNTTTGALTLANIEGALEAWSVPLNWFPGQPGPRCVFRYFVQEKSDITCSALSAGCTLVAYSNAERISVLALDVWGIFKEGSNSKHLKPHRLSSTTESLGAARILQFGPKGVDAEESAALYAVTCDNDVAVISIKNRTVSCARPDGFHDTPITMLCVDQEETFLCVGSAEGNLFAYRILDHQLQPYMKLPRFSELCTSMTFLFSGDDTSLLVTYLDEKAENAFTLYHMKTRKVHPLSERQNMSLKFREATPHNVILGCSGHPIYRDVALFFSSTQLWVYSFLQAQWAKSPKSYVTLRKNGVMSHEGDHLVLVDAKTDLSSHYVSPHWLDDGSLLACHQGQFSQVFAPALFRKKFAT